MLTFICNLESANENILIISLRYIVLSIHEQYQLLYIPGAVGQIPPIVINYL